MFFQKHSLFLLPDIAKKNEWRIDNNTTLRYYIVVLSNTKYSR